MYVILLVKSPYVYSCYSLNNKEIERASLHKGLGVHFHSNLSFQKHLSSITYHTLKIKTSQMLGLVTRTCNGFTSSAALRAVYCSVMRTQLDYIRMGSIL